MQTRRDQAQAYRFVTRRIVSALLLGEPDTNERPMRRFGLAVFGGAMIAAIVFAGVGVVGFLFPSGAKLGDPSIVIERETGARYVYTGGVLYPVLNYASARLALGSDSPAVKTVSLRSLRNVPRGQTVGIANLPDPLPDRTSLLSGPWSACSLRRASGSADFVTHVLVGRVEPGGQSLANNGMLVLRRNGNAVTRWLLWNGHRLRTTQRDLTALGLSAARGAEVTGGFLDGIPLGPDLSVPSISRVGQDGPNVGGKPAKIGQVFRAAGQTWVLLSTGLSAVGPVMRDLLLSSSGAVTEISADAAASARSGRTPTLDPPGFPTAVPQLVFSDDAPAMVCAVSDPVAPADAPTVIQVYEQIRRNDAPTEPVPARIGPDGTRLADRVVIPGGNAALVKILPAPGDTTANTTTYLVSDQGVKYALPRVDTDKVLASLGYSGIAPQPVPVYLLSLLAIGPTFDPVLARNYVTDEAKPSPTPSRSSTPTPSTAPSTTAAP
jgi:type VII secretion protein EccB